MEEISGVIVLSVEVVGVEGSTVEASSAVGAGSAATVEGSEMGVSEGDSVDDGLEGVSEDCWAVVVGVVEGVTGDEASRIVCASSEDSLGGASSIPGMCSNRRR